MSQLQHPCKKLRKGTENEQVPRPNKDQKPSRTELWGWERMESGKRWKRKREENRKSSPWCHRHHHMQELFFSIAQGNKSNIVSLIMRMRDAQKSPRRLLRRNSEARSPSVFDAAMSKMQQIHCTYKLLSETPPKPIFGQVEASTLTALIVRNFSAKNEVNPSAGSRDVAFQLLPMQILA